MFLPNDHIRLHPSHHMVQLWASYFQQRREHGKGRRKGLLDDKVLDDEGHPLYPINLIVAARIQPHTSIERTYRTLFIQYTKHDPANSQSATPAHH